MTLWITAAFRTSRNLVGGVLAYVSPSLEGSTSSSEMDQPGTPSIGATARQSPSDCQTGCRLTGRLCRVVKGDAGYRTGPFSHLVVSERISTRRVAVAKPSPRNQVGRQTEIDQNTQTPTGTRFDYARCNCQTGRPSDAPSART